MILIKEIVSRVRPVRKCFQNLVRYNHQTQDEGKKLVCNCTKKSAEDQLREERESKEKNLIPLDTTFNDHILAYNSKYSSELVRALCVYNLCSINYLVENNLKIMKFFRKFFGKRLFGFAMKKTFYGHFVAGEDDKTLSKNLKRLKAYGILSMVDYSAEEDLSSQEAEDRDLNALLPAQGDRNGIANDASLSKYHPGTCISDRRVKLNSARTFFYLNESSCERNAEIFIDSLLRVSKVTKGTGIVAIKLTALGRPQLLLQLSEVIMRARTYMAGLVGEGASTHIIAHHKTKEDLQKYFSDGKHSKDVEEFLAGIQSDDKGVLHLFPWHGILDSDYAPNKAFRLPDSKTGQMKPLMEHLSRIEEDQFHNLMRRLVNVCETAKELDAVVVVDAEQTYFQPAISRITLELMRKYNKEKVQVMNTYQTYLKEAYCDMTADMEEAERLEYNFAAKIVRGAYILQERERAEQLNYPDPINPDFDATTSMYHATFEETCKRIRRMLDAGSKLKMCIMVASHNEDTIRFAVKKMKEYDISHESVIFGQLYGMCDYITFPMGQAGYSSYKYVPYGPIDEVLPYLSRRSTENAGIFQKVKKEKALLKREIYRRIRTGKWRYKPKGVE